LLSAGSQESFLNSPSREGFIEFEANDFAVARHTLIEKGVKKFITKEDRATASSKSWMRFLAT
jgi:hypothetical protein